MTIRHTDSDSPYQLNFFRPTQREEIWVQGQTFEAYEQTRPPEQQTPLTPRITNLLEQLQAAYRARDEAERQYTIASDKRQQLHKKTTVIINKMWKSVTGKYEDDPSEATHWGFTMKPRTRNVLRPQKQDERLALLNAYITKEESQPEEERFRVPELAQVIELRDTITANMQAYQDGQNQQENSFEAIKKLTKQISDCLQAAAIHLLAVEFDFELSTQLQNWGYDITLKRRSSSPKESEAEAEATAEATTTTETPTEETVSTNGTGDLDAMPEIEAAINK